MDEPRRPSAQTDTTTSAAAGGAALRLSVPEQKGSVLLNKRPLQPVMHTDPMPEPMPVVGEQSAGGNLQVDDITAITSFKRFKRNGSTSQYKGVFYVKKEKKYRAQICIRGKKKYVGTFATDREAALARDEFILRHWGNIPELLNFSTDDASSTAVPSGPTQVTVPSSSVVETIPRIPQPPSRVGTQSNIGYSSVHGVGGPSELKLQRYGSSTGTFATPGGHYGFPMGVDNTEYLPVGGFNVPSGGSYNNFNFPQPVSGAFNMSASYFGDYLHHMQRPMLAKRFSSGTETVQTNITGFSLPFAHDGMYPPFTNIFPAPSGLHGGFAFNNVPEYASQNQLMNAPNHVEGPGSSPLSDAALVDTPPSDEGPQIGSAPVSMPVEESGESAANFFYATTEEEKTHPTSPAAGARKRALYPHGANPGS